MADIPLTLLNWRFLRPTDESGTVVASGPVAEWVKPETGESMTEWASIDGVFTSGFSVSPSYFEYDVLESGLLFGLHVTSQWGPVTVSYPDDPEFDGFKITRIYIPIRNLELNIPPHTYIPYDSARQFAFGGLKPVTVTWGGSRNIDAKNDEPTSTFPSNTPYERSTTEVDDQFVPLNPRKLKFDGFGGNTTRLGGSEYQATGYPTDIHGSAVIEYSDGQSQTITGLYDGFLGDSYAANIQNIVHDFAVSEAAPTRVQVISEYGQRSQWKRLRLEPWAEFDAVDDGEWQLDGSKSFDLDGNIVRYLWFFVGSLEGIPIRLNGFSGSRTSDFFEGKPELFKSFTVSFADANKYGTATRVFLLVTDNEGYQNYRVRSLKYQAVDFGSFVDTHGTLYTAVNEGTGVRVRRFLRGQGTPEMLALVEDAANPSLYKNNRGEIVLGSTALTNGIFQTRRSFDSGGEFE